MVIGTDYGHADPTTEISAILRIGDDARLDEDVRRKILDDNPRRLYGLD
jgi:predicted TIM-barrel fold metal-dependent hydrolase